MALVAIAMSSRKNPREPAAATVVMASGRLQNEVRPEPLLFTINSAAYIRTPPAIWAATKINAIDDWISELDPDEDVDEQVRKLADGDIDRPAIPDVLERRASHGRDCEKEHRQAAGPRHRPSSGHQGVHRKRISRRPSVVAHRNSPIDSRRARLGIGQIALVGCIAH